jgi:nicotinamide-nucleotide amidase
MIAEILATGDEVRSGALVDTNSAYIAARLEEAGVPVSRHQCVGDDLRQLVAVLQEIAGRADMAVVTGGLGPTTDDLTAEACARAAGVALKIHAAALASMEALFEKLGRKVTGSNRKQAFLPEGADCLVNPVGTAPGFAMRIGGCRFFFLPGVPREMKRMLQDRVLPEIGEMDGGRRGYCLVKTLSSFGLTESVTGERLAALETAFPGLKLGLRAKFPEIQVKLYAQGWDKDALDRLLLSGTRWVRERIGDHVFSDEEEPMAAVVGRLLSQRGATLAIAESCTGGLVSNWLTDIPGSSDYFLFSGVTYANASKVAVLGVDPQTLSAHGAVSEAVAAEMAAGARRVAGAAYGLATTGIAGPSGGTEEKPVGTVCIGLATEKGARADRFQFPYGGRRMKKMLFAMKALDLLRRELTVMGDEGVLGSRF